LIDERVTDHAEHRRRLCTPDGYRPAECPKCHHRALHLHDHLTRSLFADALEPVIGIVRYRCVGCEATWRILPAFVARHLWRSWDTIEATTIAAAAPPSQPPVPKRTLCRWWSRLLSAATVLAQLFATSASAALDRVAYAAGHEATRQALVRIYAEEVNCSPRPLLLSVAAITHRLMPGLRLM
jgi:hypothetical protein